MIGETLLSRYKITKVLGGGGFSDTYLAQDMALPGHPLCVVKHLCPKERRPGIYQVARELFEREATVLYQLGKHADVPSLYAHFEQNKEFFLVQEYIQGHDIAEELRDGHALNEQAVIQLLIAILEPLTILHQKNFIHRDIKPHNLRRRSADGRILLIDFGAVKEIQALTLLPSGETSRTIAIGSPGYMPSEQVAGRPKLASDVYAVGMVGIQALTGRAPREFEEDPMTGAFLWQQYATVSSALSEVLETMVHPYHLNRYPNAQEALVAVRQVAESPAPTMAASPLTVDKTERLTASQTTAQIQDTRGNKKIKRFTLPISLGAIALILGVVAGVVAYQPGLHWLSGAIEQPASSRTSPVTAVEQYYRQINERRLSQTWKQLTPSKQEEGGGFRSYLEWWNRVDAVYIRDIELQSESSDRALVKAELWYSMKNGAANREQKNSIDLQWDHGAKTWLIDHVE